MSVLDNDVPELSGEPTLAATADLFLFSGLKLKTFLQLKILSSQKHFSKEHSRSCE